MELIKYISEIVSVIYDAVNFGPSQVDGLSLAIEPFTLAAIAVGSQALGKGISHLFGGKERRRARRRADRSEERQNLSLEELQGSIGSIGSLESDARDRSHLTDEELFGAERDRRVTEARDAASQQSAGARGSITRSLLSGGGDVTGAAGITLNRLQETTNRNLAQQIGGIETEIAGRGEASRRYQAGRADNFALSGLSAQGNIFANLSGQAQNAEMLRIQQRQAQNQMGADIGSSAANLAALSMMQPK